MPRNVAKILLVDEEPDTRQTFAEILAAEGHEVVLAETGEEALAKIDGYMPDVVVLDILLRGKTGIEVARELSRRSDAKHIPIVMITALHEYQKGKEGLADIPGIRRFLYKPCRPRTLLEGIDDAIRFRRP